MRRLFGTMLLGTACLSPPALAVEASVGVTGWVTVYPDMGACGGVVVSRGTTMVGELSSAGAVTGPGTATAPVRGAAPFVVPGGTSWYGCLPDAYAGATAGHATYTLSATTGGGDFVAVVNCVVTGGEVTCR